MLIIILTDHYTKPELQTSKTFSRLLVLSVFMLGLVSANPGHPVFNKFFSLILLINCIALIIGSLKTHKTTVK